MAPPRPFAGRAAQIASVMQADPETSVSIPDAHETEPAKAKRRGRRGGGGAGADAQPRSSSA
ncbi:MAG: hypothetical protein IPL19_26780 [Sandaracinaceae bacterium]|nr:hypothetical protein [Sandaracinaceae bacterium]